MASKKLVSPRLRTPEPDLSKSRQSFIQTLEDKKQFEADCAVIIPVLDGLWKEKILTLLGYNIPTDMQPYKAGIPGFIPVDETHAINWKHYLFNYTPQLLSKAITRLASRLTIVDGKPTNTRGEVANVSAYFKSLVQDLRKREIKRENLDPNRHYDTFGKGNIPQAYTDNRSFTDYVVGQIVQPWGIVTLVNSQGVAFFGDPLRAVRSLDGDIHPVECSKCYLKEGSFSCVHPTHKSIESAAQDKPKSKCTKCGGVTFWHGDTWYHEEGKDVSRCGMAEPQTPPVEISAVSKTTAKRRPWCGNGVCKVIDGKTEHHLHCPERGPGWQ